MQPNCEHHYASHLGSIEVPVRTCTLCGAVDFGDLAEQVAAIRAMVRDDILRKMGIHPDQIAERLAQPAKPDSLEEIQARRDAALIRGDAALRDFAAYEDLVGDHPNYTEGEWLV